MKRWPILSAVLLLFGCGGSSGISSVEEFNRLESPLKALDPQLQAFASKYGMTLTRNNKNWPERSLTWGGPVQKLIQIYLEDKNKNTFNLWVCASEDRGNQRYWKNDFPKKNVPLQEISSDLDKLLEFGRQQLESWKSSDFIFATQVRAL